MPGHLTSHASSRCMNSPFNEQVALVTGAGSGIGRAVAQLFGRAGARVVVADWDAEGTASTLSLIKEAGGQAIAVTVDVSNASQVEALVESTVAAYGRLDCAVNNAAIQGRVESTIDCTEENWDRIVSINLKGVWLCLKYELAQMLRQGGGKIVNVGSNFALVGSRGMPAYCAAKHGLVGLTKTAALEYAKNNIRINMVCPGPTNTAMPEKLIRDQPELAPLVEGIEAVLPIGRMADPFEVAEAIICLCSGAASAMVGSIVAVDGGFVAQ
jgi:NAD(P)-dependent dehydrogenase (short-subunit alcohol dehydrogenase family)